jgi:hypothetical protein
MPNVQFSPESWRTGAESRCRVAVRVVPAGAHVPAVPAKGVDGAGPVAVVASVSGLADTRAGPGVAPEGGGRTVFRVKFKAVSGQRVVKNLKAISAFFLSTR